MSIRLPLFALALLLSGCVSPHTPSVWIGSTFDEINTAFGQPSGVLINSEYNRVYAFELPRSQQPVGEPTPLVYGGDAELRLPGGGCVVLFEFHNETASRWQWEDAACAKESLPLPYQFK